MEVVVCVPGGHPSHVVVSGDTKDAAKKVDVGETVYYALEPGESITVAVPGMKTKRTAGK